MEDFVPYRFVAIIEADYVAQYNEIIKQLTRNGLIIEKEFKNLYSFSGYTYNENFESLEITGVSIERERKYSLEEILNYN